MDTFDKTLEIEETLQDFDCFYCSINPENKRPHPDSYGSIFDPKKVTDELLNKFSKEEWTVSLKYWWGNPNCDIQWKVVCITIASKLKIEIPKETINEWDAW